MRVLAIDPGGTSGIVVVEGDRMLFAAAEPLSAAAIIPYLDQLNDRYAPDVVVVEDYRVYRHKLYQHANSDLHTARVIGAIEAWCGYRGKPLRYQMASEAKGFFTDRRLLQVGLYHHNRHVRDAIRHALHYLRFRVGEQ